MPGHAGTALARLGDRWSLEDGFSQSKVRFEDQSRPALNQLFGRVRAEMRNLRNGER
jgi:hypothetical protein